VTGLAFLKQYLLNVIESLSDRISFLDVRKLSSTIPQEHGDTKSKQIQQNKMLQGSVDNYYYKKSFGDSCSSSKGCSSIVIRKNKMLVNSLDNIINMYDMNEILNSPPKRFYGHKSSKDFYGKCNTAEIYSESQLWLQ
jgi:hypothetical protein